MRTFALKDSSDRERETLAVLTFYERDREFYFDMPQGADPWAVPLVLSSYAARGIWEVGPEWSRRWVESRVVPSNRQNLGEVLRANGLDDYDEFALLVLTGGRNSQDDCYLEPLEAGLEPAWFADRESRRIADAVPLDGARMALAFRDGVTRVCNVGDIAGKDAALARVTRDEGLFARATVGAGGRCVRWGTTCRLADSALRAAGEELPISWGDVGRIASAALVDAAETAALLGCSRQNVNALASRRSLRPVKVGPKCTLFLRADVLARLP